MKSGEILEIGNLKKFSKRRNIIIPEKLLNSVNYSPIKKILRQKNFTFC